MEIDMNSTKWCDFKNNITPFVGEHNLIASFVQDSDNKKEENELSFIHKNGDSLCIRRYFENEDGYLAYDKNSTKIFEDIKSLMGFLRDINFDHAIHYEYRNLSKGLIKELYKNKDIDIKDILNG